MKNNNWSDLNIKEKIAIISAVLAFVAGWGLTIAGFVLPPLAEISDAVLWVLGQSLIYAASVFGVTSYFSAETAKMKHDIREQILRMQVNKDTNIEDNEED